MNEPYTDKELRRIRREDHRSPPTLRFLATIARLQEMQECSACKAIHYLHPNAKQGDFSGPRHSKVGATCDRCGEMWPCDVTELREGYARLQERVEAMDTDLTEMTATMAEHFDVVDLNDLPVSLTKGLAHYKALAERRKEMP